MNLRNMVGSNERIIWQGKPQFKCFVFETIINPFLFVALLWGAFDFFFLTMITKQDDIGPMKGFFVIFLAIHLMPVWLYLGSILFCTLRYRRKEYLITDKGIYISGGIFAYTYEMKPYTDLSHINLKRGIFDQMFGVGDVILECGHASHSGRYNNQEHEKHFAIEDIEDFERVFKMVKDLQTDVFADTMYPNDLRPKENNGYNTEYRGRW